MQFSPDGSMLALLDEEIFVWRISDGRSLVHSSRTRESAGALIRFSESSRYFGYAVNDLRVWDLKANRLIFSHSENDIKPLTAITALYIDEESSSVVYAADCYDYGVNMGPTQFMGHR